MITLTHRQAAVLMFIVKQTQLTGFPPSRAEIARRFGFASTNAATCHMLALQRKGYLAITAYASRGVRLTDQAIDYVGPPRVRLFTAVRCESCGFDTFAPERPCFGCRLEAGEQLARVS